jgi:hypothetical protein
VPEAEAQLHPIAFLIARWLKIPNSKHQIPNNLQIPNFKPCFGNSVIESWDLFWIWNLGIGI